jgi:hypothetical protein
VQPGSTIPGDENRRTRVDYSDLEQNKSKDVDKEPRGTMEEEGGGIGNVGWGLDFVLPGEEPPNIPQQGVQPVNGDTTRKATSDPNDIAGSSGPTVNPKSISGTSNAVPTKHASTLRLVKIDSSSTSSSTTTPSSSSPLPTTETLAILDARPSGYILGRDKHLSLPVLRLKELAVSKIHAAVWFGWRGKHLGEEILRTGAEKDEVQEESGMNDSGVSMGERRFWIVDCGSTHGTFLQNSKKDGAGDSHRLSPARTPSSPFPLKHLDRLTIGSTTFECHLHPDWPCENCALNDPSSVIPLTDPEESAKATTYTSAGTAAAGSGLSASAAGIPTVPGNWKETEERRIALTAEAKRADTHRRSALAMKKLRESYFGGGGGGASSGGEEKTSAATGGKRKWEHKRESDEGWKKKRGGDAA